MTFDEWIQQTFTGYKDDPAYDINLIMLKSGNLRKAWDAGREDIVNDIKAFLEGKL